MKPCDCHDEYTAKHMLDHQGLTINDKSIEVHPSIVKIRVGPATLKIPQNTFKRFAEWYLEDQDYVDEKTGREKAIERILDRAEDLNWKVEGM